MPYQTDVNMICHNRHDFSVNWQLVDTVHASYVIMLTRCTQNWVHDRHTERSSDRQIYRQIFRQTDVQIDGEADMQKHFCQSVISSGIIIIVWLIAIPIQNKTPNCTTEWENPATNKTGVQYHNYVIAQSVLSIWGIYYIENDYGIIIAHAPIIQHTVHSENIIIMQPHWCDVGKLAAMNLNGLMKRNILG